jgi:hypothetical protein
VITVRPPFSFLKVPNYIAFAGLKGEECERAMPRFHFSLVDGLEVTDTEGKVLPDQKSARKEAEALLEEFKWRWRSVRIRDATGNVVETVSVEEDEEEG